jgi:spore maturation protein CgeB
MKFVVCTGHPLESQANAQVRQSVMDGLISCFGGGNVTAANISGAASVVASLRPDIVLGLGSYLPETTYFGEVSREARRIGARTVFWATEDPYEQDASYRIERDFDALFSCDRWGVNFHRHRHAYHLPLAGCGIRHYREYGETADRPIDLMFCGVAFSSRKEIIEELRPSLSGLNISVVGPGWGQFGFGFSDRRIEKDQLIELYGHAKIVLNLGRSLHFENQRYMIVPSSPGPRTFEAALAGTVQFFHEDTYEIRRYFAADEVPSFSNKLEFDRLLKRYMDSPALRHATARKAQARALAEHTYARRMVTMMETLKTEGLL